MAEHPLHQPILRWYAANARDLPWRAPDRTAWGVLVSEVMLQQTPVNRVLPVWSAWMQRWPGPADLAAETPGAVIRAWGRLGYPRRALRLHEAATAMVTRHSGKVPRSHDELLALPGIGEYTAAAVASFAFGARHPVVDTNVRRVHARAVTGDAQAAPSLTAAERDLARRLVPEDAERAATWAVAVMELGALVCTARAPRCELCPVRSQCRWQAQDTPEWTGPRKRAQKYQGTDRYVRGLLLAALRDARASLTGPALLGAVPDAALRDAADPGQRDRCLHSLIADGLVEPLPHNRFRLPA